MPPAAPTLLTPNSTTETTFLARWNASAGATGYKIDVATDGAFTSFVPGWHNTDVGNVTSATVTGVSPGMLFYRLRAYNSGGTSANSSGMSATYYTLVRALNTASFLNVNDGGSNNVTLESDNNLSGNIGWFNDAGLLLPAGYGNLKQVISFNTFGADSNQTPNPPYQWVDGDTSENGPDYNGPLGIDGTPGGGVAGIWYLDFDASGNVRKSSTLPSDFQQYNYDGTLSGLPSFNQLAGGSYASNGQQSTILTVGKRYQITWGANDTKVQLGFGGSSVTYNPYLSVVFTVTLATDAMTLFGVPNAPITVQLLQLN